MIITPDALNRSLTDNLRWDSGLAEWAITSVSDLARETASRPDWDDLNAPGAVQAIVSMAARRLYTNPDRFTREASGDYSYGLDSSVTSGDIFTPREIGTLMKYAPGARRGGLRTLSTTREPTGFPERRNVPDGTRYGFPWYGEEEFW